MKRRPNEQRETVDQIIAEKLAEHGGDVSATAIALFGELDALRSGGIMWAEDELFRATYNGLKATVRQRMNAQKLGVGGRSIPARYSIGGASAWWLDAPASKLGTVAKRLIADAVSRFDHAEVLEQGRELAAKHRVATAAEGFAAEGIEITELAS